MSDPASHARQLMQEKENIEAEIVSPGVGSGTELKADPRPWWLQDAYRSQLQQVSLLILISRP